MSVIWCTGAISSRTCRGSLPKMCDPAPGAPQAPCKTELSGSSAGYQNESTFIAALIHRVSCRVDEQSDEIYCHVYSNPRRTISSLLWTMDNAEAMTLTTDSTVNFIAVTVCYMKADFQIGSCLHDLQDYNIYVGS